MNKLIGPTRVEIAEYFTKFLPKFKYVGVIEVLPMVEVPKYQTWDVPPWNAFSITATRAKVDGVEVGVLPVFFNEEPCDFIFDTEITWTGNLQEYNVRAREINTRFPYIAYFKGNDDWSHGLRFATAEERLSMVNAFGQDLGTLQEVLGQN